MKTIFAALCLMLLPAFAAAELTSLEVAFTPDATSYEKGASVGVTAVSNGTNAQYRFELHRVVTGSAVAVVSNTWSSTNTFVIDTAAVNVLPGKYRLRVYARENANKPETLVKSEFFQISEPRLSACDSIDGQKYVNPTPLDIQLGDLNLAQTLDLSSGLPVNVGNRQGRGWAGNVKSFQFQDDVVNVRLGQLVGMACVFMCIPVDTEFVGGVTVPFTCEGNVVTLNPAGAVSETTMSANPLLDLLGTSVPLTLTGSVTIDTASDKLTSDGIAFE